jgi:hypothetical protein
MIFTVPIHYAAAHPAKAGPVDSRACTRFQSSPSSSAENCAADNRITPSSIFGPRNSPSSSRLCLRQECSLYQRR